MTRTATPLRPLVSWLLTGVWNLPEVGLVRIRSPTSSDVEAIDATWPDARTTPSVAHWEWKKILRGKPERFALIGEPDIPLAIWCGSKSVPLRLEGHRYYRLDYFEVDPARRASVVGVFCFGLIAARAIELGADGVVLGALAEVAHVYEKWGGVRRRPAGWHVATGLQSIVFAREAMHRRAEDSDGFGRKEGKPTEAPEAR